MRLISAVSGVQVPAPALPFLDLMASPSDSLLARVLARAVARFVRGRRLWGADDRIAVAVSGGSDSVALAFIVRDLERVGLGHPAGLIHVNHQLRGAESDADEAFCAALAARLGWSFEVSRVDVARRARDRKQSIESAARGARYE